MSAYISIVSLAGDVLSYDSCLTPNKVVGVNGKFTVWRKHATELETINTTPLLRLNLPNSQVVFSAPGSSIAKLVQSPAGGQYFLQDGNATNYGWNGSFLTPNATFRWTIREYSMNDPRSYCGRNTYWNPTSGSCESRCLDQYNCPLTGGGTGDCQVAWNQQRSLRDTCSSTLPAVEQKYQTAATCLYDSSLGTDHRAVLNKCVPTTDPAYRFDPARAGSFASVSDAKRNVSFRGTGQAIAQTHQTVSNAGIGETSFVFRVTDAPAEMGIGFSPESVALANDPATPGNNVYMVLSNGDLVLNGSRSVGTGAVLQAGDLVRVKVQANGAFSASYNNIDIPNFVGTVPGGSFRYHVYALAGGAGYSEADVEPYTATPAYWNVTQAYFSFVIGNSHPLVTHVQMNPSFGESVVRLDIVPIVDGVEQPILEYDPLGYISGEQFINFAIAYGNTLGDQMSTVSFRITAIRWDFAPGAAVLVDLLPSLDASVASHPLMSNVVASAQVTDTTLNQQGAGTVIDQQVSFISSHNIVDGSINFIDPTAGTQYAIAPMGPNTALGPFTNTFALGITLPEGVSLAVVITGKLPNNPNAVFLGYGSVSLTLGKDAACSWGTLSGCADGRPCLGGICVDSAAVNVTSQAMNAWAYDRSLSVAEGKTHYLKRDQLRYVAFFVQATNAWATQTRVTLTAGDGTFAQTVVDAAPGAFSFVVIEYVHPSGYDVQTLDFSVGYEAGDGSGNWIEGANFPNLSCAALPVCASPWYCGPKYCTNLFYDVILPQPGASLNTVSNAANNPLGWTLASPPTGITSGYGEIQNIRFAPYDDDTDEFAFYVNPIFLVNNVNNGRIWYAFYSSWGALAGKWEFDVTSSAGVGDYTFSTRFHFPNGASTYLGTIGEFTLNVYTSALLKFIFNKNEGWSVAGQTRVGYANAASSVSTTDSMRPQGIYPNFDTFLNGGSVRITAEDGLAWFATGSGYSPAMFGPIDANTVQWQV